MGYGGGVPDQFSSVAGLFWKPGSAPGMIRFPSTVAVGTYRAEVYLIRDDRVIAAQSTPLFVDKQGVEQEVFDYSRREPAVYGFIAVMLAVAAGWLAALVFRR